MTYVYIASEPGLWTVGFYDPTGQWNPESDHEKREDAVERVRILNGGQSRLELDTHKRKARIKYTGYSPVAVKGIEIDAEILENKIAVFTSGGYMIVTSHFKELKG